MLVAPGGSRAAKRAPAGSTNKKTTPPPTSTKSSTSSSSPTDGWPLEAPLPSESKYHQFNDPPALYRPYLTPGVPAKHGDTAGIGFLMAAIDQTLAQDPVLGMGGGFVGNLWGFRFDYNPQSVALSQTSDLNAFLMPQDGQSTPWDLNYQAMSLSFMICRQEEVARGSTTRYPGVNNSRSFAELGTMYDLEFLYRVCNGNPTNAPGAGITNSAMFQVLQAMPVDLVFNKAMYFRGYISELDVQHQLFSKDMVPTVTFVNMGLSGIGYNDVTDIAPPSTPADGYHGPHDKKTR